MAGHRNLYCLISSVYCQMPPNTRINLIKKDPTKQDITVTLKKRYRIAGMEVDCD